MKKYVTKAEALYQSIKEAEVGGQVIIHNSDGSIWCIVEIIVKEDGLDR